MKDKGIKFETLRKPKLIRNLVILFMITFIGSAIYFKTSSAKYQTTQVIPIINTKVVNKPWWTLNITKDNEQTTIKSSGTIENNEYIFESYAIPEGYDIGNVTCTRRDNNVPEEEITLTNESNKIKITDNSKKRGTICEVTIRELLNHKILADNTLQNENPDFSKTSCLKGFNTTNHSEGDCGVEENGLYKAEDDYGTTYYYRGSINNNWVKFGQDSNGQDIWWRIIRINGNGTARLIYAGVGNLKEVSSQEGYFMNNYGINKQTYSFLSNNYTYNQAEYAGYMYTEGQDKGFDNNSEAKTQIDEWYKTNLNEETYLIDGATGFCGDRSRVIGVGIGSNETNFGAYGRLVSNKQPSYICPDKINDLYTTPLDTNDGNKKLKYPVGMITADEVAFAGGVNQKNNYGYWLYTGSSYWNLSPFNFNNGSLYMFALDIFGNLLPGFVNDNGGIRPVVNLKAGVTIADGGNGTINNPYLIEIYE